MKKKNLLNLCYIIYNNIHLSNVIRGCHGRDGLVVRFTTTCAINVYCEFEPRSWWGVLDTTLCDKVYQRLTAGRWFSPVYSINKTGCHHMTEILLKVVLSTINKTKTNVIRDYMPFLYFLSLWRVNNSHLRKSNKEQLLIGQI
jgi:hypothetical protein